MKKTTIMTLFIALTIILQSMTLRASAQSQFQVVQSYWGSTTNPSEVGPGDRGVTLSVVVQNVGLQTYSGLDAILFLTYPFSNITSGHTARGLLSGSIAAGQSVTIQFQINVDGNAQVGSYTMTMSILYGTRFGSSESLSVPVLLLGRVNLEASINPSSISPGSANTLTFTVSNKGTGIASKVSVTLTPPTGVSISGDNQWQFQSIRPNEVEVITLNAYAQSSIQGSSLQIVVSIAYADAYGTSRTSSRAVGLTISPTTIIPLVLIVKNNELKPGALNTVNVNILNNQTKPISSVQAVLASPSSGGATPLVIFGDNNWFFPSIGPLKFGTLNAQLMVSPDVANTNYQLTLTLSYLDPSNIPRTENHAFGVHVLPAPQNVLIMSVDQSILTAGLFNQPRITVLNSGKAPIHLITATIILPTAAAATSAGASIILSSGNQWYFDVLQANSNVTFSPRIFAALSAVDTSYQLTLSISYTDENMVSRTETKSLGFSVQGLIYIQVQDLQISPSRAAPGDNITILGNLLNRGNVPGMYTTVDAKISSPYIPGGTQYVGEVDPNTITPFSITTQVDRRAQNGTYPIKITINYADNYNVTRSITSSTSLIVNTAQSRTRVIQSEPQTLILGMTPTGLFFFVGIAVLVVVTTAIFLRNRRMMSHKSGLETSADSTVRSHEVLWGR